MRVENANETKAKEILGPRTSEKREASSDVMPTRCARKQLVSVPYGFCSKNGLLREY